MFDEDYVFLDGGKEKKKKPIQLVMTTSKNALPLKRLNSNAVVYGEGHNKKFIQYARDMNKRHDNRFKFVICYDDCVEMKNRGEITQLILCDRNKNISGLISTQGPKLVGPGIRNNMNRVLLLKCFTRDGTERNTDIYLKTVLPHDWKKEKGYSFYEWWCKPGRGAGFLINFLDAEAIAFSGDRSIFRIDDLIKYFESGKSRKQLIKDLTGKLKGNEEDLSTHENAESEHEGSSSPERRDDGTVQDNNYSSKKRNREKTSKGEPPQEAPSRKRSRKSKK